MTIQRMRMLFSVVVLLPALACDGDRGPAGERGEPGQPGAPGDIGESGPPGTTTFAGMTDHLTNANILDGSIEGAKLVSASVAGAKLVPGSIGVDQIADSAVEASKLAAGAVGPSHLAAGAVETDAIADGVVTSDKLAFRTLVTLPPAAGANANVPLAVRAGLYPCLRFADGSNAEADFVFQLPADYVPGRPLRLRVHWSPLSDANGGTAIWWLGLSTMGNGVDLGGFISSTNIPSPAATSGPIVSAASDTYSFNEPPGTLMRAQIIRMAALAADTVDASADVVFATVEQL